MAQVASIVKIKKFNLGIEKEEVDMLLYKIDKKRIAQSNVKDNNGKRNTG
ncbi:MAG: hypothetical protein J6Y74_05630 [Clostridia bacterium]|nr:hypothetical protein [Clostridia bacterium]